MAPAPRGLLGGVRYLGVCRPEELLKRFVLNPKALGERFPSANPSHDLACFVPSRGVVHDTLTLLKTNAADSQKARRLIVHSSLFPHRLPVVDVVQCFVVVGGEQGGRRRRES